MAAAALLATLAPVVGAGPGSERAAAAVGLLLQARDATAALIGLALLRGGSADPVGEALRRDSPVQATQRVAVAHVELRLDGGVVGIAPGQRVWLVLGAAERGDHRPATFGAGPHACPSDMLAVAIARGFVETVLGAGWRPVGGAGWEPRPNLRMPAEVLLVRA